MVQGRLWALCNRSERHLCVFKPQSLHGLLAVYGAHVRVLRFHTNNICVLLRRGLRATARASAHDTPPDLSFRVAAATAAAAADDNSSAHQHYIRNREMALTRAMSTMLSINQIKPPPLFWSWSVKIRELERVAQVSMQMELRYCTIHSLWYTGDVTAPRQEGLNFVNQSPESYGLSDAQPRQKESKVSL
jgi:hypothetical protein